MLKFTEQELIKQRSGTHSHSWIQTNNFWTPKSKVTFKQEPDKIHFATATKQHIADIPARSVYGKFRIKATLFQFASKRQW